MLVEYYTWKKLKAFQTRLEHKNRKLKSLKKKKGLKVIFNEISN